MPKIRPVSDLRNNFAEISRVVHETREPVILTKNGYGDMVVISYEEFERLQYETTVSMQLKEAEVEAATTTQRYTHTEVMDSLRARLKATAGAKDV
ncbi:type II toxin-antitoxin system Phd/YefM family antitoxin [Eubacteriales bacterium OttesenSCG-928-A19]|nr:type II toxin-antitoxin system Phd/YefM family antitoxin [Eubacteriales bacterium OttesenSCG-928-A19]